MEQRNKTEARYADPGTNPRVLLARRADGDKSANPVACVPPSRDATRRNDEAKCRCRSRETDRVLRHLRSQLALPLGRLRRPTADLAQALQLRKELVLRFVYVMLDVLAEHRHETVEVII